MTVELNMGVEPHNSMTVLHNFYFNIKNNECLFKKQWYTPLKNIWFNYILLDFWNFDSTSGFVSLIDVIFNLRKNKY